MRIVNERFILVNKYNNILLMINHGLTLFILDRKCMKTYTSQFRDGMKRSGDKLCMEKIYNSNLKKLMIPHSWNPKNRFSTSNIIPKQFCVEFIRLVSRFCAYRFLYGSFRQASASDPDMVDLKGWLFHSKEKLDGINGIDRIENILSILLILSKNLVSLCACLTSWLCVP